MKKYLIFLICLTVSIIVFGQNKSQNSVNIEGIEVAPPQFTGIENVVMLTNADKSQLIKNYLVKKAKYPKSAAKFMEEGTEVIQFTITPTGEITNLKVINSVCAEIDKEVIRVLKTTNGMWKPGYNNNEPVAMDKEVSLIFLADDYNDITKHFTTRATNSFTQGNKKMFLKQNHKKALKYYNQGMKYLPYDKSLLYVRGICKYELGDKEGALKDWNRIVALGGMDFSDIAYDSSKMKGYDEMAEILKK